MREIKFRAWDKNLMQMFPVDGWQYSTVYVRSPNNQKWCQPKENIVLMQYTGLKDKNGKEIYEGDIVQYAGINCVIDMEVFSYLKPIDRDAWFDLDPASDKLFERSSYFEIIGNIYENPELLTQND
jgi:hypothetical protein